jgi:hypothetical protein
MNAPGQEVADAMRSVLCHEEMIEQLGLVAIYAGIAQQLVEVGDAAGSDYAIRRMGAHARAAVIARNHLKGDDAEAGAA